MIRVLGFFFLILALAGCAKEPEVVVLSDLEDYIRVQTDERDILIACATGESEHRIGTPVFPVQVFFYPIEGAADYRLFVSGDTNINENDYSQYSEVQYQVDSVFAGKLRRFNCPDMEGKWAIVTYNSPGKYHVSDPIKIKHSYSSTYYIDSLVNINENGVNPEFNWATENEPNNIIYFEVVTDTNNVVVSATYTYDKFWTFYDLSNVVLNVHDVTPTPTLLPNNTYNFTLMGVSEDNWVHTVAMKQFQTN